LLTVILVGYLPTIGRFRTKHKYACAVVEKGLTVLTWNRQVAL